MDEDEIKRAEEFVLKVNPGLMPHIVRQVAIKIVKALPRQIVKSIKPRAVNQ